ncbi:hypothetical protein LTR08_004602 [Meristemomyces frigidus]|nr:hypothetical protein LTR08_004602 [Meristemomyces frigidus]
MADDDTTPSNVTAPRRIQKRKAPASRLASNKAPRTSTPNAYARRTPPPDPLPIADEDDAGARSPPRQLKRPGGGARIAREQAESAARRQRDEEVRRSNASSSTQRPHTAAELVAEHYNAVPERGREWRKTDSQIKGLRSLNNWVKSTLIQNFSRPDVVPEHGLTVLDMACGKGGDLGKWDKAPLVPALYVGCDIAEVSVDQAKQRYAEGLRKGNGRRRGQQQQGMEAQFYVQDTFGRSLGDIPIIRQVGFNPNAGPGNGVIQGGMATGGFDVVSMMFALHYSFESEALARGMLKNVAGALKKGGKFLGVMPNSDVISATVKRLLQGDRGKAVTPEQKKATEGGGEGEGQGTEDWDPEKAAESKGEEDAEWDPEVGSEAAPLPPAPAAVEKKEDGDEDDDWDPEKPAEPTPTATQPQPSTSQPPTSQPSPSHPPPTTSPAPPPPAPLTWGNAIYTITFPPPPPTPTNPSPSLPPDGVFRPPYGWKYHYSLLEAVNAAEYVVPWEGFRALAEEYGLELMYRRGFRGGVGGGRGGRGEAVVG